MISISVSCEETEIPALKELLAGIFAKSAGIVEVAAPAPELRVLPDLSPGPNPAIESAKQFEQEQAALNKIEQIADLDPSTPNKLPITKPIDHLWQVKPEIKVYIKQLSLAGKTTAEIKTATGITDGRIINGVLARGKPRRLDRRTPKPTLGEQVKALREQGASRREAAAKLGVDMTSLLPTWRAEAKGEALQEQAEKVAELKPLGIEPDVVKRILDLDRSKLTPRAISDTLEEERGLVVSATEVMDVIVRNQKKLL